MCIATLQVAEWLDDMDQELSQLLDAATNSFLSISSEGKGEGAVDQEQGWQGQS